MHWEHFGKTKSKCRFTYNLDLVGEITVKSKSMGLVVTLCTFEVFSENSLLQLLLFLLLLLVNNQKTQIGLVISSHTNMQITKHINDCLCMRSTISLVVLLIITSYLDTTLLVNVVSCIGGETVCSCCVVLPNRPDHPPPAPVAPHHPLHLAVEEAVGEADHEALRRRDHGLHGVGDGHHQGNPDAPHRRIHKQG